MRVGAGSASGRVDTKLFEGRIIRVVKRSKYEHADTEARPDDSDYLADGDACVHAPCRTTRFVFALPFARMCRHVW